MGRLVGRYRALGRWGTLAVLLAWTLAASAQTPVGTAFTYQGRLSDGGSPASGTYDFRFTLYGAPAGGSQVGPLVTRNDVTVAAGLFTVPLDFGAVFDGNARFLEIAVRPGSSTGGYTIVGPRQELTPSAHAVFSQAVPWTGVSGKPAELVPPGAVLFFDRTGCPEGWTPLAEAQGRTIVGLNPGGTLKGGWPLTFPSGGLGDQVPSTISGASAVPSHTHMAISGDEASHTHAHDHPAFDTASGGTHTHTTDTTGSSHSHGIYRNNGAGGSLTGPDVYFNLTGISTFSTTAGGTHTHDVTSTNSAHTHQIDMPNLPAGGAGSSHTHAVKVGTTGNATVDVTMPYVQLLVCRKD